MTLDALALVAVTLLAPGPVPEPFASLIALGEQGMASGLSPEEFAARLIDDLRQAMPATTITTCRT